MVDSRTNFAKEISALLRETYGSKIKVFTSETVSYTHLDVYKRQVMKWPQDSESIWAMC